MIVQRTFKKGYAEELASAVREGNNLDLYAQEKFPYESDQVVIIPTLAHPDGLLDKMIPTPQGDCDSAIALYEAYPNLTPLQASDRTFWIYLAHVDLFPYIQKRFPKVMESSFEDVQYVLNHWFFTKDGQLRHSLSGLWWLTHLSVDESASGSEKYKFTRYIFRDYTFRTNFANYSLAKHKEALMGYFQFMMDNPDVSGSFLKERNRFITKHFNKVGGTRLLSTLPREYFIEELERIRPQILNITSSSKGIEGDDDAFE